MRIARGLVAGCLALLMAAGPAGSDAAADGYAVRLRVTAAPGGGVQRLELPAAAIGAQRSRDGSDVRIFDGRGRPAPIARLAPARRMRSVALPLSPILGTRDAIPSARVSVRLDEQGRARLADVESAAGVEGDAVPVGVLLDARGVRGAAERLAIAADLPAGQPVRFTVEASRDLDQWRSLGERVLFRAPDDGGASGVIALRDAALDRDYLRLTWRATSRLIAPVTVRRAVLESAADGAGVVVPATLPELIDAHAVEFVGPAAPLTAIRIHPAPGDGPIPVRLLGRDEPEQPWTPIARGLATADGAVLALDGARPRLFRLEADARGAGFSAPPRVRLAFGGQAIAFATAGGGPFTLAVGREGAGDAFTPLADLSAGGALPQAMVAEGEALPLMLEAPDTASAAHRRLMLWLILLAAVAVLGGLVWLAWRRGPVAAA